MKYFTLFQLNQSIKNMLNKVERTFWISAEIAGISKGHHYYLELVQKDNEQIVAKNRATLWHQTLRGLSKKLGTDMDLILDEGSKVLIETKISYHEVYGLSLSIIDVEAAYTIGELALKQQETLKKLEEKGLLEKQRLLPLPLVIQKIAVVSSAGAAGFGDFMNQLQANEYGYTFKAELFPGHVQGERAVNDMLVNLAKLEFLEFDAVFLIRGGGSRLDLEAYNNFGLAEAIAQLNTPVITGIGHQRDSTVADAVAWQAIKTPTAAAEWLINHNLGFEYRLQAVSDSIRQEVAFRLQQETEKVWGMEGKLVHAAKTAVANKSFGIQQYEQSLLSVTNRRLEQHGNQLAHFETKLQVVNPLHHLAKGYAMLVQDGKMLLDASELGVGEVFEARTAQNILRARLEHKETLKAE